MDDIQSRCPAAVIGRVNSCLTIVTIVGRGNELKYKAVKVVSVFFKVFLQFLIHHLTIQCCDQKLSVGGLRAAMPSLYNGEKSMKKM